GRAGEPRRQRDRGIDMERAGEIGYGAQGAGRDARGRVADLESRIAGKRARVDLGQIADDADAPRRELRTGVVEHERAVARAHAGADRARSVGVDEVLHTGREAW